MYYYDGRMDKADKPVPRAHYPHEDALCAHAQDLGLHGPNCVPYVAGNTATGFHADMRIGRNAVTGHIKLKCLVACCY